MRINVNNMSAGTAMGDLRELFEAFGTVTSVIFAKDPNGKLQGLIEMPNSIAALMAIISLNGRELSGQKIGVHQDPESLGAVGLRKRPSRNRI